MGSTPPNISLAIQAWQQFLSSQSLSLPTEQGYFGPETRKATLAFQTQQGLDPTGVVEQHTLEAAQAQGFQPPRDMPPCLEQTLLEIGPHRDELHECRPYFL